MWLDRGPLLPQGQLQVGVVYQDPDRIFIGGQVAEWQASTLARASQSLYSEQAWTRFKARKLRQEGREYGYFTDVLDIMLSSGVAYVGVLRAQAGERLGLRLRLERALWLRLLRRGNRGPAAAVAGVEGAHPGTALVRR